MLDLEVQSSWRLLYLATVWRPSNQAGMPACIPGTTGKENSTKKPLSK